LNSTPNKDWYVIINPHAGSKKTQEDWPKIRKLLVENDFSFDSIFTEYQFHATELAMEAICNNGYRNIIVIGGDGTLNEVVNGVYKQEKVDPLDLTIGVITVGTGNDWGRMYNLPSDYNDQVEVLKTGRTFLQDVGQVSYLHHDEKKIHYFMNIAGMGFDALVAKKTNIAKQKGAGGVLTYLVNLVAGLFQFTYNNIEIEKEGKPLFKGKVFSMSIGICSYNGGGMMQLPFAISDDGLFDVTIIRKVSRMKVIRNIKNLYDGSFVKIKEVETYTGKEFKITSVPIKSVFLETDGESLGNSPLYFNILHKAIKVIIR